MAEHCIVPDWPAPACVKALVTTRAGGVSTGPYASMNLGSATGDAPAAVEENRKRVRGLLPNDPCWLKQVHGKRVVVADALTERVEADAAVAREPGTVCALLVADCLPVLLTDRAGSIVGAAHAGWRGLAAGVIEETVDAMRRCSRNELLAYIGPGIGVDAFEVGEDVYRAFTARDAEAAAAFRSHAPYKWHADLAALARRALAACGISDVYGGESCTYSDPERFFSYRRERTTGRMAALIWREA